MSIRSRRLSLWLVLAIAALAVGVALLLSPGARAPAGVPRGAAKLIVEEPTGAPAIARGFLGLSLEYPTVPRYAGTDPGALDPVFDQLVRNISGRDLVLRIGGDSTDWTWWPVAHMNRPAGVRYTLTPRWLAVAGALTRALDARVILGIDFEADSRALAAAEAGALVRAIGRRHVAALELGNEPNLYGSWAWYRARDGALVRGRPASWDFPLFVRDYTSVARALPRLPLAGPTTGAVTWMQDLGRFLSAAPRTGLVTLHDYPLQRCYVAPSSPQYPTIAHLLASTASLGIVARIAPYVALAHARGVPVRVDEINTNSCGSAPRVTETFASALWALETMLAMAQTGVDGVDIHTYPASTYRLFAFGRSNGRWTGSVEPEYYGLLMFAQAAPAGARLLHLEGAGTDSVSAWALQGTDRRIRIVLINDRAATTRTIAIRTGSRAGATVERLQAPSLQARTDVTLGGESFGPRTVTGRLPGPAHAAELTPTDGYYVVRVPAASAALVTLP